MWLPIGNTIMRCGSSATVDPAIAILADGHTVGRYIASNESTITKLSNLVTRWNDYYGSGHDLVNGGGAGRPTWTTPDSIIFDGAANYLYGSFAYIQPVFVYLVFRQITWTSGRYIFDGAADPTCLCFQTGVTPSLSFYAGAAACANNQATLNTYCIMRALLHGASSKLIIDGGTPATDNPGTTAPAGFTIGAGGAGGAHWSNIEVKEIILRDIADSAGDEAAIYAYLGLTYGL